MRIEPGRVRAPELARAWLNSPPLSMRQLRGKVVLIDFWDYTCVNCIHTLPYVKAWHERYRDHGLVVIGVHTPEFTFAQYESNVERGVREFDLTYPILIDSNFEVWQAFANRCWPAKYLIDSNGYVRYAHFGEGAYQETEAAIQELLREINPAAELPALMAPLRDSDRPGAVCFCPTPELYLGYRRGRIGNRSGFVEDQSANYSLDAEPEEGVFYAHGRWRSTAEFLGADEAGAGLVLKYSAAAVNLVMSAPPNSTCEVLVRQDGRPLSREQATDDTSFRNDESYIVVDQPRMYSLIDNRDFGTHTLELLCRSSGVAAFAFTFTSCVDPEASRLYAGSQAR
ncbi:MAG TPA: redoxin domain-containing protein [Terriglobales bacterium]|nr:redoxin domain-containing protein [Terriglobales bacterium]